MDQKEIKKIDIKEFRKKGYLQELNRLFLHPLGLALEVKVDKNNETLGGIWDYRKDEEGIYYDIDNSDKKRRKKFIKKKDFIFNEQMKRTEIRNKKLGFFIEPIKSLK